MEIVQRLSIVKLLCAFVVLAAGEASGAVVANLQADYDAHTHVNLAGGTGIVDTDGTGTWDYAASPDGDFSGGAPTLTPLTFTDAAFDIRPANIYIGVDGVLNLPGLTSEAIFTVQPDAAVDELGIHPGSGVTDKMWITWTSGISGVVDVTGWIHNISGDGGTSAIYDGVDLSVFNDSGSLLDSYLAPSWGFTTMDANTNKVPFGGGVTGITVDVGDKLYFRVDRNSSFAGDNSGLQIQIQDAGSLPLLRVNRDTGSMTLELGPNSGNINILGYSITSESETLDRTKWLSIADNYDMGNGGSVDPDNDWIELTGDPSDGNDLSEAELEGGNGAILTGGQSINLGSGDGIATFGPWIQGISEDLELTLLLEGGGLQVVPVAFEGNGGQAFGRSDLDFDGDIDASDWIIYRDGLDTDLSSLLLAQAYHAGDLDGDGDNDINDFELFKIDFLDANPGASFEGMLASVPEPSSFVLLGFGSVALLFRRRRSNDDHSTIEKKGGMKVNRNLLTLGACLATLCMIALSTAHAAPVADLRTDYTLAASGQTSDDVGIPGTASGTWHYYSDTDADPLNGGLTLLTSQALGGQFNTGATGDGYADVGTIFGDCCGPMPAITDGQIFSVEGATPAGMLTVHPGGTGDVPPEYVVIEFRATTALNDVAIDYEFNNPSVGGDGTDWTIFDTSGASLYSGVQNGNSVTGVSALFPDMAIGESLWMVVGNGPNDNPGGDLTFASLSIEDQSGPMTAVVNTETGAVTLKNPSGSAKDIDFYSLASAGEALDATNWYSLQEQDFEGNGAPGTGNGWEESGGSGTAVLTEAYLLASSSIASGSTTSLGHAFNPAIAGSGVDGDLTLTYRLSDGTILPGAIEYVTGYGDMNGDGVVDSNDVNPFVLALTDRAAFDAAFPGVNADIVGDVNESGMFNLGDVAAFKGLFGGGTSSSQAVPEPSSIVLLSLALLGMVRTRSK